METVVNWLYQYKIKIHSLDGRKLGNRPRAVSKGQCMVIKQMGTYNYPWQHFEQQAQFIARHVVGILRRTTGFETKYIVMDKKEPSYISRQRLWWPVVVTRRESGKKNVSFITSDNMRTVITRTFGGGPLSQWVP